MWKRLYKESEKYPDDSGLAPDAPTKSYDFTSLRYFGDCRNTVDVDRMWDATQMSGVLRESVVVPFWDVEDKIQDGDRKIPGKLKKWLTRNQGWEDDQMELVCGLNERQRILFIYINELDIHFFFDARWN